MDDEQTRHDCEVAAGTVPAMVKEALERYDYDVTGIDAPSTEAQRVGEDGSNYVMEGEATVQIAEENSYRSMVVKYELGPTHSEGSYSFVKMAVTLWIRV